MKKDNILVRLAKKLLAFAHAWCDDIIREGDKVMLDTDRLLSQEYGDCYESFHQFVEKNRWRIFTAHMHDPDEKDFSVVVELAEEPGYLFCQWELIRVDG